MSLSAFIRSVPSGVKRRLFDADSPGTRALGRIGLSAYYTVTGRGGDFLLHKQEYHRRRALMEREFLDSAERHPEKLRARPCPACGGTRAASSFHNPVGFRFEVCADDGTVYMNPCPSEAALTELYNSPAESFKWVGRKAEDEATRPSNAHDLELLLRMAPDLSGGHLLDVGCATGGFLMTARARFQVEGVELNDTTAGVCRRQGLAVTTGRLADVPGEARFQVITMLQLVEHLVDVETQLAHAARLLAPGGALYLSTPAVESASFELFRERHIHVSSFGHVSLFTKAGLTQLARRSGFDMTAHTAWGGVDCSLADLATYKLTQPRFSHRMALYSPRVYYGFELLEETPLKELKRWMLPDQRESYQSAILRRR